MKIYKNAAERHGPDEPEENETLTLAIPAYLLAQLELISRETQQPIQQLIIEAVQLYWDKHRR